MSTSKVKTAAERQAAFRNAQKAKGFKELRNVWASPKDHEKIKKFVSKLNAERVNNMLVFEISMRGEMSEKIQAESKINAVEKFAKSKKWDQQIGAQHHSNIQASQYTVGSNSKGWHEIWVREV